jgi:uncharacterized protein YjiS (DUF1127 family)
MGNFETLAPGESLTLLHDGDRQLGAAIRKGGRMLAHLLTRRLSVPTQWVAWRAEQRRRRQIVRELNAHTPRELRDLGFSPADFPAILNGTYSR